MSLPIAVALTVKTPSIRTVAPITKSPAVTSTGNDSPVTKDLSMCPVPVTTTESTGICEPVGT